MAPPPRIALLVIDMQRFFAPMTTRALPNIQRLLAHFDAASAPVVFTQHGHDRAELAAGASSSPSQLVRRWGVEGSIARGSESWELQEEMQAALDAGDAWPRLVHKNTYDAFINTDLAATLEEAGVKRTVVCGVMTDCCW